MDERRSRGRSYLRLYWLCVAIVSLPVFVTSAVTGYWLGMGIGLMLGVMGLSGYRRSTPPSEPTENVVDKRL